MIPSMRRAVVRWQQVHRAVRASHMFTNAYEDSNVFERDVTLPDAHEVKKYCATLAIAIFGGIVRPVVG